MDLKPKAVVFDVDGVLVDSSRRLEACLSEIGGVSLERLRGKDRARFWRCFLSERYIYLDRLKWDYIKLALELHTRGYNIVVLTGRPESMKLTTLKQLEEAGLLQVVSEVIHRRSGDSRSEAVVKLEYLRRLAKRYDIEIVYEDSETIARLIERELPEVKVILVDDPR